MKKLNSVSRKYAIRNSKIELHHSFHTDPVSDAAYTQLHSSIS